MAANAIYILDLKGKVILTRNYRGDLPSNVVQRFVTKLMEEEDAILKPIIEEDDLTYIYIKHTNLYCSILFLFIIFLVMAVSEQNANAPMILLFLYQLIKVVRPQNLSALGFP
jgi:AP-1 complex subunit mu